MIFSMFGRAMIVSRQHADLLVDIGLNGKPRHQRLQNGLRVDVYPRAWLRSDRACATRQRARRPQRATRLPSRSTGGATCRRRWSKIGEETHPSIKPDEMRRAYARPLANVQIDAQNQLCGMISTSPGRMSTLAEMSPRRTRSRGARCTACPSPRLAPTPPCCRRRSRSGRPPE